MIERNSNEVNIVDIKGDVMEKMLHYMQAISWIIDFFQILIFSYSGKEPDYGKNPKMAAYLLKAADKYELIRLKVMKFFSNFFTNNFFKIKVAL